jgi:hypothetical protein
VVSEVESALAEVLPVMSAAAGAYGAEVLTRVEDAAADVTVGLGRRLLQRVWRGSARPEAVKAAVAELAEAPGDADALAGLRLQVRKVLAQDPQLLEEIAGLLPARGGVMTASGERSVAVGGNNSGSISTGDGAPGAARP